MYKYKVGDFVVLGKKMKVEEYPTVDASTWGGEITECFIGDNGRPHYVVQLDAIALASFSKPYLLFMEDEGYDIEVYHFEEGDVILAPQRGTEAERSAVYKDILNWLYTPRAEDFETEAGANYSSVAPKKQALQKPWTSFSKNQTIQVKYKDGFIKTGKFKRLQGDLESGACEIIN